MLIKLKEYQNKEKLELNIFIYESIITKNNQYETLRKNTPDYIFNIMERNIEQRKKQLKEEFPKICISITNIGYRELYIHSVFFYKKVSLLKKIKNIFKRNKISFIVNIPSLPKEKIEPSDNRIYTIPLKSEFAESLENNEVREIFVVDTIGNKYKLPNKKLKNLIKSIKNEKDNALK